MGWAGALALCLTVDAGNVLHLKTRAVETASQTATLDPGKRLLAGFSRLIVQYDKPPQSEQLESLRERGGQVLAPVPEDALVVLIPDGATLDGLEGIIFVGRMQPEDKVSPSIEPAGTLIAEFFPDVTAAQATLIILRSGLTEIPSDGLLPYQKVVRGGIAEAKTLAAWNETAYVFPALSDLAQSAMCRSSGMSGLVSARMGQYVASSASSWSAKGEVGAQLRYFVEPVPAKLSDSEVREAFQKALAEWERFTYLRFEAAGSRNDARTLSLRLAAGDHGDSWPFDGPGRVLAHAFYPAPLYAEPLSGDMHIDLDEQWTPNDLYSVMLHEAGHALGLVHSDDAGSVMYPMYRRVTGLGGVDIAAIRELYGVKKDAEVEEIGLEVSEVFRNVGEFAPGELVAITGKAWGGDAEGLKIRWKYGSGGGWISAVGAFEWMAPVVPIFSADEEIIVEVTDRQGRSARQSVRITRE